MSFVISLAVGLVVGVGYALIGVRSPAPPLVALVGLLGMVGGEQLVPMVKAWIAPPRQQAIVSSTVSVATGQSAQAESPTRLQGDRMRGPS